MTMSAEHVEHWWIDGHLDLAYIHQVTGDVRHEPEDRTTRCVSLPALRAADVRLAFATIYVDIGEPDAPWGYRSSDDISGAQDAAMRQLELYESFEAEGQLAIVRSRDDLEQVGADRLSIVLLMEGADPIVSADDVGFWYDRGVRLVGLTWAKGSRYAGGNASPGGLSRAGRMLVDALDEVGMVHDISHLADAAVDALLEQSQGPVVATHSNARGLMGGGMRHLPDRFVDAIDARQGVVGLNLCSRFLTRAGRAGVADCLRHLRHMVRVTGRPSCVAMGSDADGGFPPSDLPAHLDHPTRWGALLDAMDADGWDGASVRAFANENWMRLLRSTLRA